jgi:hypothetical protein
MVMESCTGTVRGGGKLVVYCIFMSDGFMEMNGFTRAVTKRGKLIVYCTVVTEGFMVIDSITGNETRW